MSLTRKPCIFTFPSALFSHVVCVFNKPLHSRSCWFDSRRVYFLSTVCRVLTIRLIMLRDDDLIEMASHLCPHVFISAYRLSKRSQGRQPSQNITSRALGAGDDDSREPSCRVTWQSTHTGKSDSLHSAVTPPPIKPSLVVSLSTRWLVPSGQNSHLCEHL